MMKSKKQQQLKSKKVRQWTVEQERYLEELEPVQIESGLWMGIDPGVKGGFAVIGTHTKRVFKMPDHPQATLQLLKELKYQYAQFDGILLEQITTGFQGNGKSQMAKLYGSYRELIMALVATELTPFHCPIARTWQSQLGIPARKGMNSGDWKNLLKCIAQKMFPQTKVTLSTADALLMAEAERRHVLNL